MYKLSKTENIKFFFLKIKFFGWFIFSHHPLCKNYYKETYKLGHVHLCRGCSFFYSTLILSFIFLFSTNLLSNMDIVIVFLITNILAFPSFVGSYFKSNTRIVKDFYRISLGIAVSIPIIFVLNTPILEEKLLIGLIMAGYLATFRLVRQKHSHDNLLCDNCKNFTEEACLDYKNVFISEREHSKVISDYLQEKLVKSNFMDTLDYKNKSEIDF